MEGGVGSFGWGMGNGVKMMDEGVGDFFNDGKKKVGKLHHFLDYAPLKRASFCYKLKNKIKRFLMGVKRSLYLCLTCCLRSQMSVILLRVAWENTSVGITGSAGALSEAFFPALAVVFFVALAAVGFCHTLQELLSPIFISLSTFY